MNLILFCVESARSGAHGSLGGSDEIYITCYLKAKCPALLSKTHVDFIDLKGKSHYDDGAVRAKIRKLRDKLHGTSPHGRVSVVYCLDTDSAAKGSAQMNKAIAQYCDKNGFCLVWFDRDIEDVFWDGMPRDQKSKKANAEAFAKRDLISMVREADLSVPNPIGLKGKSNLRLFIDGLI